MQIMENGRLVRKSCIFLKITAAMRGKIPENLHLFLQCSDSDEKFS